jgi:hypothetical protein
MVWYPDLPNFRAGKMVDAEQLNQLQSNLKFMHDLNYEGYFHDGSAVTWTTTNTVLTAVGSEWVIDITTTGGPVLAWFQGTVQRANASEGYFYMTINRQGDPLDPLQPNWPFWAVGWKPVSLMKPYHNLPAGEHRFRLYWMVVSGTQLVQLRSQPKPFFVVMEGV